MEDIINNIMAFVNRSEVINKDKQEIIKYGLEILLLKFLFWLSTLIIGIIMGTFFECLIYISSFIFLRSYAGGYHANSRIRCFIQSIITILSALTILHVSKNHSIVGLLLIVFSILSGIIIFCFAPIDSENKSLSKEENIIFKKKARLILIVEIIAVLVLFCFKLNAFSNSIMLAIITSGVLVLLGKK